MTSTNTNTVNDPHHQNSQQESCKSCLYVGVATCAGMAVYFIHLGCDEQMPTLFNRKHVLGAMRNKPWMFAISAAWVGAGAYRWHLN
jgi:hypothetical protein